MYIYMQEWKETEKRRCDACASGKAREGIADEAGI
jgi:hypothetical protein